MKFKKLVLIITSTTIAAAGLIALAAACHDKNQKKPGNGNNKEVKTDSKTLEDKDQQTKQKQTINPELNQKQTDKSDAKKENEKSTNLSKIQQKQQKSNNTQKEQTSKLNQQSAKNQNNDSMQNSQQKLNSVQTSQQKIKNNENKQPQNIPENRQENINNVLTQDSEKKLNSAQTSQQKIKNNENKQPQNIPENRQENINNVLTQDSEKKLNNSSDSQQNLLKNQEKTETEQPSDVKFVSENPKINQDANYSSYLQLKINENILNANSSNKIFQATLTSNQNPADKLILGRAEYSINSQNIITFDLIGNIDINATYSLKSITYSDYSSDWNQINSKSTELNISQTVKAKKIAVQKINHNIQLSPEEEQKTPVTVSAKITKNESKYNIELSFDPDNKDQEINQKYATILITYNGYTGLNTINGFEPKSYKIKDNKVNIMIDSKHIEHHKEIQLQLQRITDQENPYFASSKFRLNFKDNKSEFDKNKTQFFKLKESDVIKKIKLV